MLKAMSSMGLVWELREPPRHIVEDRPKHTAVLLEPAAVPRDEALLVSLLSEDTATASRQQADGVSR